MTTRRPLRLASLLGAVLVPGLAALAGCGSGNTEITVGTQMLKVVEQNYGTSGDRQNYCAPLTILGQFEVMLTDQPVCDEMRKMDTDEQIFHSGEIAVLRFVFPGAGNEMPLKVDQPNVFQVGRTDCTDPSASHTDAVAFFAHNPAGQTMFDVNEQADSGMITIAGNGYDAAAMTLNGTYEVTFSGQTITGAFSALYCSGLTYDQMYAE